MRRNGITPPRVKFELHAYGEVYDFSLKSLDNWKMLEFTLQRDKTSGIFHQISFPFEFVLDAYDVVKGIFDKYQYRAKADMYIYQLKDTWPYEKEDQYFEPQIFNLDWTQYNKLDNKIEIDTKRTSLYDFIKAKNKIVYDIPVSKIKEDKQWHFERIELENSVKFRVASEFRKVIYNTRNHKYSLGIATEATEISVPDIIYTHTVGDHIDFDNDKNIWFAELNEKVESSNIKAAFDLTASVKTTLRGTLKNVYIELIKRELIRNEDGEVVSEEYKTIRKENIPIKEGAVEGEINWIGEANFEIRKGERLYLIISYDAEKSGSGTHITHNVDGIVKFYYNGRHQAEGIDLIEPKVLLQSLVDSMTESKGLYQADIEDFNTDRNNLIMLSAAESIRGIQKTDTSEPQVHTTYRNFVSWMNAYGYEQHVNGSSLTFRKRHKSFRGNLTAIELGERECADLREYVNEDYLYSGLKIGYTRKDIEDTNVRFEFNGVHDYSTDLSLGENILELISPYRADCYGIEFLTQERGKDTTDDKADKDLFLINVSEDILSYKTVKNTYSGNYPNDTIFNGNLNPYNLMRLNESLLGVSVERLTFAASDSNSQIVIDEQRIDTDYDIPEGIGLFDPIIYDIASRNIQDLPMGENVNGIVRFRYKGQTYEGYIGEVSKNMAWEMETIWILYKKKG